MKLTGFTITLSDPYTAHSNNRWTPQIERYALAIKRGKSLSPPSSQSAVHCPVTVVAPTNLHSLISWSRFSSAHFQINSLIIFLDLKLQLAVAELKSKFLSSAEALLHGDLHR